MNATLAPSVLKWARVKAEITQTNLAQKLLVRTSDVIKWEMDGVIPFGLVEKLAKKTDTPFGYLFLQTPPVLPDLKAVADRRAASKPIHKDVIGHIGFGDRPIERVDELVSDQGSVVEICYDAAGEIVRIGICGPVSG